MDQNNSEYQEGENPISALFMFNTTAITLNKIIDFVLIKNDVY